MRAVFLYLTGFLTDGIPYVLITLRDDRPVNFSPAFVKAVSSDNYLEEAIQKIEEERNRIDKLYSTISIK